ncbi:MAG TPA: flagellar assembly peptidoglycan hydrolase FlgJ [Gammaproteobacteria bacterium]|nr:flagellar assembly peptidoglycan hydrolase FlgJ [Gammaproteobacteria bacterium]
MTAAPMTTSPLGASFNFADLGSLAELKREAAADSPDARRAVAQQFEALFLGVLLKQMRQTATAFGGGLFDDERRAEYQSMLDQQLALSLSRAHGVGIADSLMRFLDGGAHGAPAASTAPAGGPAPAGQVKSPQELPAAPNLGSAAPEKPPRDMPDASPSEFVAALWPHAEKAARQLGVAPDVLVAQAALETGWGRGAIRGPDGRHAFNLFGIKASGDWGGARVRASTLEFVGGVPERRREQFRAYASLAESFEDYVDFVKGHARYAPALESRTAEGYVRALQDAGYATDPGYADKILAILERGLPGRPADQLRAASADNTSEHSGAAAGADGGRT